MWSKYIPSNNKKEAGSSREGLLPCSLRMLGEVSGGFNQATTIKIPLNADNEDNVMVLGEEEWEDLFGKSMEITNFSGFSCESSSEDDIGIDYNNKERQTWTKTLNAAVMECYFLGWPVNEEGKPIRGYRRRMQNIWKERYDTEITEQQLCDQARIIRKNEWITKLELENIRRYFKKKKIQK